MALALPKFRWLIIGAVAAGVWVAREDMKGPRPPERVPAAKTERSAEAKPRPAKPVADKPAVAKPAPRITPEKPVPPKPVAGKPAPPKAVSRPPPADVALTLPKAVEPPPQKPQKIATGSIKRPDKPAFVQTTAKVNLRAQARADASVIATFEPRTVVRELARSGEWRLVMGDGRKGWVRADYLAKQPAPPRRPKLPVAEVKQAKAAATKPAKAP